MNLNERIQASGLKKSFLANEMGITLQAFSNKVNGKTEFRESEIVILCRYLKMPVKDFFSASNSHTAK